MKVRYNINVAGLRVMRRTVEIEPDFFGRGVTVTWHDPRAGKIVQYVRPCDDITFEMPLVLHGEGERYGD